MVFCRDVEWMSRDVIAWWATGFGVNVYVDEVQVDIISFYCETLVLDNRVVREKMVFGQLCVGDGVVDKAEITSSPADARASRHTVV